MPDVYRSFLPSEADLADRDPRSGSSFSNAATDVRRKRRALSPDEFSRLLESARTSEVQIQCFDGETRARIYTTSYLTGLRRAEIASLSPASFDLEGNPPIVTLQQVIRSTVRKMCSLCTRIW